MIVKGNNPNKPIGRIESQQPHFCRHPDLFLLHLEISHFCEDASLSDRPEPSGDTDRRVGVSAYRRVASIASISFFGCARTATYAHTPLLPYADPCPQAPVRRSASPKPS
jgi:hypothetical protein